MRKIKKIENFCETINDNGKFDSKIQSAIKHQVDCGDETSKIQRSLRYGLFAAMDSRECVDHLMMSLVLSFTNVFLSFQSNNEIKLLSTANRAELKQDLETVTLQCSMDDKNLEKIFNKILDIRNETLEALQYEYCTKKYCVDNRILELDYELNPNNIATADVNCTYIIDTDRKQAENEFVRRYDINDMKIEATACTMEAYNRNEKLYGFNVAFKLLRHELNARRTKEADVIRVAEKLMGPSVREFINNCSHQSSHLNE